jgi:hypothetical protein
MYALSDSQFLVPHGNFQQPSIFVTNIYVGRAWLRQLIAGLSPRRPGFDPGSVHVGFVVDKVALGHVFLRVLRFSPVNFIPPLLH